MLYFSTIIIRKTCSIFFATVNRSASTSEAKATHSVLTSNQPTNETTSELVVPKQIIQIVQILMNRLFENKTFNLVGPL